MLPSVNSGPSDASLGEFNLAPTEPVAYNTINDDDVAIVMTRGKSEYANCLEMQRQQDDDRRRKDGEEFFQHAGTTLEATVELFNELFPHLAAKLAPDTGLEAGVWTERLISYWNEIGIDQATISATIQHLGIDTSSTDGEQAVRLLFQRFAEALTGICLSHPCSTAIVLTAFDELKATRLDASEATERRRQAESELAECQRRITLLADEADERCRQVEAASAEKLCSFQKRNSQAIAQIRGELDIERASWLADRESLLNDNHQQIDILNKLQKKLEEEASDCSYWKEQARQLREEYDSAESERESLMQRLSEKNNNRFRGKRKCHCGFEYSEDSSGESCSSWSSDDMSICKLSEDLRKQLKGQMNINQVLTEKIAQLEEQINTLQHDPKVAREDSGLGLNHNQTSGVSCFDILYGDESQQKASPSLLVSEHSSTPQNEFEALEVAYAAEPNPSKADAEAQCGISVCSKGCQVVDMSDRAEQECMKLRKTVSTLEASLSESMLAFNSLRSRYHKQLLRTNQLIDLTNELYAENCRIANKTATLSRQSSQQPRSTSCSSSSYDTSSASESYRSSVKSKRRSSKHEEIYVVVGPHAGVMLA